MLEARMLILLRKVIVQFFAVVVSWQLEMCTYWLFFSSLFSVCEDPRQNVGVHRCTTTTTTTTATTTYLLLISYYLLLTSYYLLTTDHYYYCTTTTTTTHLESAWETPLRPFTSLFNINLFLFYSLIAALLFIIYPARLTSCAVWYNTLTSCAVWYNT